MHREDPTRIGIHLHITDCVESINALNACTLRNMQPLIMATLETHPNKNTLRLMVDRMRDSSVIGFAQGMNQRHPERIRNGREARAYLGSLINRESLPKLIKRIKGEIILEEEAPPSFEVQSARLETIPERLIDQVRDQLEVSGCLDLVLPWRWFKRR